MLRSLNIRNVVLIDKLDIDFEAGFGVLTGETGAGKSILLDSLGLVLGKRADVSLIRQGEEKLSVTAVFDTPKTADFDALLGQNDIDVGSEVMIKRSLSTSGVGKIFVNDQPISAKILKEIGKFLVEIHGQFDNQGLLNPANHMGVLDGFGGYEELLTNTAASWEAYRQAYKKRLEAEKNIAQAKEDEDNLRHWIRELEQISPKSGEIDELTARRQELMHAEKIIENLNYAYSSLTQGKDVASVFPVTACFRIVEFFVKSVGCLFCQFGIGLGVFLFTEGFCGLSCQVSTTPQIEGMHHIGGRKFECRAPVSQIFPLIFCIH